VDLAGSVVVDGGAVFELFRQRDDPARDEPPGAGRAATATALDDDVLFIPRSDEPAHRRDLDPQRLDGRAAPLSERQAEVLAAFLRQRAAEAPRVPPDPPAGESDPGSLPMRSRPVPRSTPAVVIPPQPDPEDERWRRLSELNRAFPLRRMVPPEALGKAGLEVESRPDRGYPIRRPESDRETVIRPEYHGVRACGDLRTRGLALMFPPHTVHARDSTATAGEACELTSVDHIHIRQAVVARDDALRSSRVRAIVTGPALRRALGDRRADRAVSRASVHRAEAVRLGDDVLTLLDSRYVVERTFIPAGALLAGSERLAGCYVDLVAGRQDDPGALAAFLGELVDAVANVKDDNVLGYADGLPQATLLGLFGIAPADHATSIVIDAGAGPRPELDLDAAPLP
jgi:hypothetical protein